MSSIFHTFGILSKLGSYLRYVYMEESTQHFYQSIRQIIVEARQKVVTVVNFAMVEAYWLIGKQIVEEEQQGAYRAEYGKNLLAYLSDSLKGDLGKGFDQSNLSNMRKFYVAFPIFDALRQELTWTHYRSKTPLQPAFLFKPQIGQYGNDEHNHNGHRVA